MDNSSKIEEAIEYATIMHKGQFRHDGSEYINHPIRVADYVLKFKNSKQLDTLIISAYLHDTLEDTNATYYDIIDRFGIDVASIVLQLTSEKELKKELGKEKYLKYRMKNMSSWALVIKLCDRLDNVVDLKSSSDEFKDKYIKETIGILDFVVHNRDLSNTHINIIKQILKEVELVNCLNNDQRIKIKTLIN